MAKSFRKFREDHYHEEGEWSNSDAQIREKDERMQSRRDRRRKKTHDKFAAIEDSDE